MNTKKSAGRYSEICGATNNRGEPCSLPAGWGTPGSQKGRCKFHGGSSTGPSDTSYLEGNDFAKDNPGGGAPALNSNAEIHGGFGDWRKAYERFDEDTKATVHRLEDSMRETAKEHAPDVDADRRDELLREKATLMVMEPRASYDTFAIEADDARGMVIEEEIEIDGETYINKKANPAFEASHRLMKRQFEIAKELRLYPGYRDDS